MNCLIRSRLSIIAVLFVVPMTSASCTQQACQNFCGVICFPQWIIFGGDPRPVQECIYWCNEQYCAGLPSGALQGCMDNPDKCAAMFELYQEAMQTCEEYPNECAVFLEDMAQSFHTDAEE